MGEVVSNGEESRAAAAIPLPLSLLDIVRWRLAPTCCDTLPSTRPLSPRFPSRAPSLTCT